MLLACLPLGPCVTSKDTFWPSLSVLKPCMLIAEKCANTSLPPPSGVMKPKPFASLNHLTVPVAMSDCLSIKIKNSGLSPPCRYHQEDQRRSLFLDQRKIVEGSSGAIIHQRQKCLQM